MKAKHAGMTLIVKTVTRLTVGLILIYGIYIVMQGHISPGGGFAGGIIIALSFIHLMLAFGKEGILKTLTMTRCLTLAALGGLILVGIAGVRFLNTPLPAINTDVFKVLSAGAILSTDIAISLLVGMGLFTVYVALVVLIGENEQR
jgi:multicomponent Na+:H+ antiporter subunit B